MFQFRIERTVEIEGCPECGLAAVDFRRTHGLPDATDNKVEVLLDVTNEQLVRDCQTVGVEVDLNGDIDMRRRYNSGTSWNRRGEWIRAGYQHDKTYLVTAPAQLLIRILAGEYAAFVELLSIHIADCRQAVAEWDRAEAAHHEARRIEAEAKVAHEARVAEARLLLKTDLDRLTQLQTNVDTLSEFLSNIPLDALQGTLKRMTEHAQAESIDSLRNRVEKASTQWVFNNRDDNNDDDDDDDDDE